MRTTTKHGGGVAKKLRKLPAVADKPAPTPKKAVEKLQNELVSLVARGYSVAKIGQVLRGAGIEISAVTLRGYVRNANASNKRAANAGTAPAKKKGATRKVSARTAASGSAAADASPKSVKKPALAAKPRKSASKSPAAPGGGVHDHLTLQLAKASFVVRPDTPDSDL